MNEIQLSLLRQKEFSEIIDSLQETYIGKRSEVLVEKICDALESIKFFREIILTTQSQRRMILRECAQLLELEKFQYGQIIFKAGDGGDKFYILLKGQIDIYKPQEEHNMKNHEFRNLLIEHTYEKLILELQNKFLQQTTEPNKIQQKTINRSSRVLQARMSQQISPEEMFDAIHTKISSITEGGSFGELALTLNKPRSGTARVGIDLTNGLRYAYLISLNKQSFSKLQSFQNQQISIKCKALAQLLPSSTYKALINHSYGLVLVTYPKNHYIYRENNESDSLYIIADGEVKLERQQNTQVRDEFASILRKKIKSQSVHCLSLAILSKGAILGYEDIVMQQSRQNSALCLSQRVVLYQLTAEKFKLMKSDLFEKQEVKEILPRTYTQQEDLTKLKERTKLRQNKQSLNRFSHQLVIEMRSLIQSDLELQSESKNCTKDQQYNDSIAQIKQSHTQRLVRQKDVSNEINERQIPVFIPLFIINQEKNILSADRIRLMIKFKKGVQRNHQKLQSKIDFKTPYFQDDESIYFKQVQRIQLDFEKLKNPQKFQQQYAIQNFFNHDQTTEWKELLNRKKNEQLQNSPPSRSICSTSKRPYSTNNYLGSNVQIQSSNCETDSSKRLISSSNNQFRFSSEKKFQKRPSTHHIRMQVIQK